MIQLAIKVCLCGLWMALSAGPLRAQSAASPVQGSAARTNPIPEVGREPLRAELLLVSGESVAADVVAISRSAIQLSSGSLSLDGIVRLQATDPKDAVSIGGAWVELVNGDRLRARVMGIEEDLLRLQVDSEATSTRPIEIPLELVRGICLQAKEDQAALRGWDRRMRVAPPGADSVFLANGDLVRGSVQAIREQQLEIQPAGAARPVSIPLERVGDIVFDSGLSTSLSADDVLAVVTTSDGSALRCRDLTWDMTAGWRVGCLFDATVVWSTHRVDSVRVLGKHLRELSAAEPIEQTLVPLVGSIAEPRRNRSVLGTPMRTQTPIRPLGWGVSSRTELTFDLERTDALFYAEVGLDPGSGAWGNVELSVLVDDDVRYSSGPLELADGSQVVRVPVNGGRRLTLRTDYGQRGDISDFVNWMETVLIQSPSQPVGKPSPPRD